MVALKCILGLVVLVAVSAWAEEEVSFAPNVRHLHYFSVMEEVLGSFSEVKYQYINVKNTQVKILHSKSC